VNPTTHTTPVNTHATQVLCPLWSRSSPPITTVIARECKYTTILLYPIHSQANHSAGPPICARSFIRLVGGYIGIYAGNDRRRGTIPGTLAAGLVAFRLATRARECRGSP
jgi:hypothetical protein